MIKFILPSLMDNVNSTNLDMRMESLKMISEMTTMFFSKRKTPIEFNVDSKEALKLAVETQFVQS